MKPEPFITLENITVRLRARWMLNNTHWQIRRGAHWVIWGPNGAGKSTLANVLMGTLPVVQGRVIRHYLDDPALSPNREPLALVSSEQYHRLYARERLLGEMRHFSGRTTDATLAGELLPEREAGDANGGSERRRRIDALLQLAPLKAKPLEALSSGEMRKMLLGRALMADPYLLVLDEPFNGLDPQSCSQLHRFLIQAAAAGTQMVLITHRAEEIPDFFTHVIQVAHERVVWQGPKAEFLARELAPVSGPPAGPGSVQAPERADPVSEPLIRLQDVTVRFGDQVVLDRVSWTMRSGENWALCGDNGAGKSTLLKLITGDQLQAYANQIDIFGQRKGSGESVWSLRQQIGYVGDDLQARYQRKASGLDVVSSGFFDSVGLYRACSAEQRHTIQYWISTLALDDLAQKQMARLSFGQQRLLLIARAMVKSPRLLILDEPCNGLDGDHCRRLLSILDTIGRCGATHLLYVSHRPDEMPSCITHRLFLKAGRVVAVSQRGAASENASAWRRVDDERVL